MRYLFLFLMIVCIVYGVSIFMIGSGTFSFTIWFALAACLGAAFHLSGNGRWMQVPATLRVIVYGIMAASVLYVAICVALMLSHFDDRGEKDLDYIIVLGAQMREDGPSKIFRFRLDEAYNYLRANPGTICIISGGKGSGEPVSEGAGGRDYLIARGIEPSRLIAEEKSTNTVENCEYSMKLIDRDVVGKDRKVRIGIVTNSFHLFRGMHIAKKLTDDEICGIAAYADPLYLPNNMARECLGILKDLGRMKF